MAIVYMLVGIPGSGKSTFANALSAIENIPIISSDAIRNLHPDWEETRIFPEVYRLIAANLKKNNNVIYDATNVTPQVRHKLFEALEPYNVEFEVGVYVFKLPYEETYRRIQIRNTLPGERYFPLDKIQHYYDIFVDPTVDEGFIFVKKV